MERANQEWSQGVPEPVRQLSLHTLIRYQGEAREGKPWPPASPYLKAVLASQAGELQRQNRLEERASQQVYGQTQHDQF